MATNFEFYKDEVLKWFENCETFCIGDFLVKISGVKFACEANECNNCGKRLVEFLKQEHIEQPKLTKRERAFCEAVQTGWIARDEGGTLYWFPQNESVEKMESIWSASEYSNISFMILDFSFIKWSDEKPWAVEDLLKLEVMEDA